MSCLKKTLFIAISITRVQISTFYNLASYSFFNDNVIPFPTESERNLTLNFSNQLGINFTSFTHEMFPQYCAFISCLVTKDFFTTFDSELSLELSTCSQYTKETYRIWRQKLIEVISKHFIKQNVLTLPNQMITLSPKQNAPFLYDFLDVSLDFSNFLTSYIWNDIDDFIHRKEKQDRYNLMCFAFSYPINLCKTSIKEIFKLKQNVLNVKLTESEKEQDLCYLLHGLTLFQQKYGSAIDKSTNEYLNCKFHFQMAKQKMRSIQEQINEYVTLTDYPKQQTSISHIILSCQELFEA